MVVGLAAGCMQAVHHRRHHQPLCTVPRPTFLPWRLEHGPSRRHPLGRATPPEKMSHSTATPATQPRLRKPRSRVCTRASGVQVQRSVASRLAVERRAVGWVEVWKQHVTHLWPRLHRASSQRRTGMPSGSKRTGLDRQWHRCRLFGRRYQILRHTTVTERRIVVPRTVWRILCQFADSACLRRKLRPDPGWRDDDLR